MISEEEECRRFAWQLGRRCAVNVLTVASAREILQQRLGFLAKLPSVSTSFWAGCKCDPGEVVLTELAASGLRGHLDRPPNVAQSSTEPEDSEELFQFLVACTEIEPSARVKATDLFLAQNAWAQDHGYVPWSQARLGRQMRQAGYRPRRSNGMWWLGLRLLQSPDELPLWPHGP